MHTGPSTSVKFDSNGSLFSCGYDTAVIRWSKSKKSIVWKAHHDGLVNDIDIRGNIVSSVGADRKVRFWNAADGGKTYSSSPLLSDDPNSVFFIDDESVILSTDDGKIIKYNYKLCGIEWERLSCLPDVYGESVEALSTFEDSGNRYFFWGDGSGNIGILGDRGKDISRSKIDGTVDCCEIDHASKQVFCGLSNGKLVAINLPDLKLLRQTEAHSSAIKSIAITNKQEIMTCSYDNVLKVSDVKLREILKYSITENSQRGWSRGLAINPTNENEYVITSLGDAPLVVFRNDTKIAPRWLPKPTYGVNCIDIRHSKIVFGSDDGCLWSASSKSAQVLCSIGSMVLCCKIHPVKYIIASGTQSGDIWINDLTTGVTVERIGGDNIPTVSMAFSQGGEYLAVGNYSGLLRILDGNSFKEIFSLEVGDAIKSITFLGEHNQLCLGAADGSLAIVDVPKEKVTYTHNNVFLPNAVGWSNSLGKIISVGRDLFIRSWNKSLQMEEIATNHSRSIKSLAISPDGSYFLTSGYDSVISLWKEMKVVNEFTFHELPGIAAIAWMDSTNFIIGGWDGKLSFGNTEGELLKQITIGE